MPDAPGAPIRRKAGGAPASEYGVASRCRPGAGFPGTRGVPMVRLRAEDVGNWPAFYAWLKNDFPQVLGRKKVIDAFTKYYVNPWDPEATVQTVGAGAGSY